MMTLSTATCLLLLLAAQPPPAGATPPPPPAEPLEVRHIPAAQVTAGTELVLRAEVAPAWRLGALVAHHRATGEKDFRDTAFELSSDGTYAAVIPITAEQRVSVEYYLTARDTEGVESVRFASAQAPYPVLVDVPQSTLEREALLAVYGQRRSRVSASAEYVDYGSQTIDGTRYQDHYYRLEANYLYRLLTQVGGLRIDSIRIGVGHLRAHTPPFGLTAPGEPARPELRPGLDYGFSEVDVGFNPYFGLGLRLTLGGNATGFSAGFGGKVRIGRPHGAHAEIGGEYTAGLGGAGTVRLVWDTVPRFPMSAAVQVTNVPSGPTGVRLLYTVDYQLTDAILIGAQAGYQARASVGGGPSLGFSASYGW
ncbi:hypothetical protein JRI60_25265 [Archangium violaceum]|uniref:hypothetical protein n=1 Tax=Archangium violaceum TaxID=83451 RepID=UPI00194E0038|nr:hypothetical protein [Archangium violaceum]QRO02083.1 hypothetical protein JRI60_25265 [Archangium violaceum]